MTGATFQNTFQEFATGLNPIQQAVILALIGLSALAGLGLKIVQVRALRSGSHRRRLATAFFWHIGMLRRSYYPAQGQHLHPWILRLYWLSLTGGLIAFLLLIRWLIF